MISKIKLFVCWKKYPPKSLRTKLKREGEMGGGRMKTSKRELRAVNGKLMSAVRLPLAQSAIWKAGIPLGTLSLS